MAWTESDRVVALRRRSRFVDVVVEMLDGWRLHLSGRNASLLSFWSFLSIFPLLVVATTILGLVLEGNPDLQEEIVDGALAEIPVLGEQLKDDPASLDGSWFVLIVGLLGALWASTRAFVGFQGAQDDIWEVAVDDRDKLPVLRLKALVGIVVLALSQLMALGINTIVHSAGLPGFGRLLLVAATTVIHIATVLFLFRYLTSARLTWSMVWPGAIAAGIAIGVIQHYATMLVGRITDNASATYGQFAIVLGLVTWLAALAIATLMAAELNAAIARLSSGRSADAAPTPATA